MRASFAILALPVLAAATAIPRNDGSQCNSGSLQCCDSTQTTAQASSNILIGLLGIVLDGLTGLVGLTCSPITGVGVSGTQCSQQSVCCTGNNFSGLVVLGCTPINLNL